MNIGPVLFLINIFADFACFIPRDIIHQMSSYHHTDVVVVVIIMIIIIIIIIIIILTTLFKCQVL